MGSEMCIRDSFWTRSMKERMNKGSDEKREEAMVYELKKIASL